MMWEKINNVLGDATHRSIRGLPNVMSTAGIAFAPPSSCQRTGIKTFLSRTHAASRKLPVADSTIDDEMFFGSKGNGKADRLTRLGWKVKRSVKEPPRNVLPRMLDHGMRLISPTPPGNLLRAGIMKRGAGRLWQPQIPKDTP
ncbi:hypothetical protein DOTSEDRAFT_21116 [Dothistroma septosporum NZE10]|uniref:Uncharacterized protein n=1 Tax=Dothistroma septosporum (strain NZE10 / CBS 128990) TaxID=675120 RepID=N1PVC7_DOTSN|nr:hypothetical protein DOTSEDRAFT_21116 [Dothistroma septosporum NZE10]